MKRRDEVAVGVLITIAVIIAVVGTVWLARGGLSTGYPLYTRFAWGQNLKQGQPVLLAGVSVGYVDDVQLRRQGYLDVTMRVNDDYQIPLGSTASVHAVGFFGDVAIALTPPAPAPMESYQPGDTVPPGKAEVGIGEVLSRVDSIGAAMNLLTQALDAELIQSGGLRDLRRTIANTTALSVQLQAIAAEQSRNLTTTLASFRRAAAALDSAQIDSTMHSVRATTENFSHLAMSLGSSATTLNLMLARLNNGEGTAGKLLTDTLLYRDIRSLIAQTDSLLADFKKNPRKYINLEIF